MPTLDEFLEPEYQIRNSWVYRRGFRGLYVKKGTIPVTIDNYFYYCNKTVMIANVSVTKTGHKIFTKLVNELVGRGWAVYVESVLSDRFADGLVRMGFVEVNRGGGRNYLKNYEGHLEGCKQITVTRRGDEVY